MEEQEEDVKKDFSLKVGEMMTINIGDKGRRTMTPTASGDESSRGSLFSIPLTLSAASMKSKGWDFCFRHRVLRISSLG